MLKLIHTYTSQKYSNFLNRIFQLKWLDNLAKLIWPMQPIRQILQINLAAKILRVHNLIRVVYLTLL